MLHPNMNLATAGKVPMDAGSAHPALLLPPTQDATPAERKPEECGVPIILSQETSIKTFSRLMSRDLKIVASMSIVLVGSCMVVIII